MWDSESRMDGEGCHLNKNGTCGADGGRRDQYELVRGETGSRLYDPTRVIWPTREAIIERERRASAAHRNLTTAVVFGWHITPPAKSPRACMQDNAGAVGPQGGVVEIEWTR